MIFFFPLLFFFCCHLFLFFYAIVFFVGFFFSFCLCICFSFFFFVHFQNADGSLLLCAIGIHIGRMLDSFPAHVTISRDVSLWDPPGKSFLRAQLLFFFFFFLRFVCLIRIFFFHSLVLFFFYCLLWGIVVASKTNLYLPAIQDPLMVMMTFRFR